MIKKCSYGILVSFILISGVLFAGCSDQAPDGTTTVPTTAVSIAKFVSGDIIAKTVSSSDLFLLILKYDSRSDKYERAFVNKKSDGSWFRSNDKSDFADRIMMEKLYPTKVGHVSSLSQISSETKTSTPVTSQTKIIPSTSTVTITATKTSTPTPFSYALPAPSVMSWDRSLDIMRAELFSIGGSNFQSGATVKLTRVGYPDVIVKSVNVASGAEIRFNVENIIPCGNPPGQYNIVVTNPDGQSGTLANSFVVFIYGPGLLAVDNGNSIISCLQTGSTPPTFKKIVPDYGTAGTAISITALTGTNFQSGATVTLWKADNPDITATNVNVQSSTLITCTFTPPSDANAGAWDVVITNPDGQFVRYSNIFSLIVSTTPPDSQDITSISPTFTYGNDVKLTINGTNFQQGFTAKMTKSTSTSVVIVARSERWDSPTQLTAWFTIPTPRQLGTYNVIVTNPDGTSHSLPNGFEVK